MALSGELFCMQTCLVTKGNNCHDFLFTLLDEMESTLKEKFPPGE